MSSSFTHEQYQPSMANKKEENETIIVTRPSRLQKETEHLRQMFRGYVVTKVRLLLRE